MSHIDVRAVRKTYTLGSGIIVALDEVSLSIEQGEFAAILGPSGSGKTTFLNVLGGLEAPDSGVVPLGGDDIARYNDRQLTLYRREHVGFVFQFFNLLPTLTALWTVQNKHKCFFCQNRGLKPSVLYGFVLRSPLETPWLCDYFRHLTKGLSPLVANVARLGESLHTAWP
ncbi:MAG: ABC transporter ATP-binding protein [Anaerolineales bacterium]